jgi:starch synthase
LDGGTEVHVFDAQLASGAKLVLFDAPALFERSGIYGEGDQDYEDNAKRFGFLARATLALIHARSEAGGRFDVVHGHDWPGALLPIFLSNSPTPPLPTVLTLHDMTRQGVMAAKQAETLGLSKEIRDGMKLGSKVNVIKGALGVVDVLTLPSERYAAELLNPERCGPLAEAVQNTKTPLVGIAGGVDYSFHNPATNSWISARYDAEDPSSKARNKVALLRELGLDVDLERPVVVCLGPLEKQRGSDLLVQALPALLKSDLTVVVAGDGPPAIVDPLTALKERYPESFVYLKDTSDGMEHKLLAAGELLVSPARHEPTAHGIQCAQRYGTLPVAAAVDAAVDAIVDCDAALETGTGVLFDSVTRTGLVAAVKRAVSLLSSPRYPDLVKRMMRQDLGWDRPSRRYLHVYRQALATKS